MHVSVLEMIIRLIMVVVMAMAAISMAVVVVVVADALNSWKEGSGRC